MNKWKTNKIVPLPMYNFSVFLGILSGIQTNLFLGVGCGEDNCFTMLWSFLPFNNMNQS